MLELMRSLVNYGGVTLKNGKEILYKSGWQVADYGVECKSAEGAAKAVENMNGNCGGVHVCALWRCAVRLIKRVA